jgi:hypothetical protein
MDSSLTPDTAPLSTWKVRPMDRLRYGLFQTLGSKNEGVVYGRRQIRTSRAPDRVPRPPAATPLMDTEIVNRSYGNQRKEGACDCYELLGRVSPCKKRTINTSQLEQFKLTFNTTMNFQWYLLLARLVGEERHSSKPGIKTEIVQWYYAAVFCLPQSCQNIHTHTHACTLTPPTPGPNPPIHMHPPCPHHQ